MTIKRATSFAVAALALTTPMVARAQVLTPLAPVQTAGGTLSGKVLASGVKAWLGVPFAKPPLYDLRWAPPQPTKWTGTWNADRKMAECMQVLRPHDINHYFGEEATSEDCLYLNIWAPPASKPADKRPVIVFFYGGGSTIGSAGSPMYDGEALAKKGVVYVTIGYRLGILGWMAHPELTAQQGGHSGNYGYLDQNAGLKWVQANIARFGGDPARVTIAGQSAGAGSVSAQMHSPLSKGLFSAAMMSSTCAIGTGTLPTLADGEKIGLDIQKRLEASSIADLRMVAADRLIRLQAESQLGYSNTAGVRPTPLLDGYFFTRQKADAASSHEMSDVPVLANFNGGESGSPFFAAKTVADFQRIAGTLYGDKAAAFLALYPVSTDADVFPTAVRIARENGIAAASRRCGMVQAQYNKAPVYQAMFNRKHAYARGLVLADQDPATIGAYHNADIPFYFNYLDSFNVVRHMRDWTPADRALANTMSDTLVAFATRRDPSVPGLKWTAWSKANDVYVRFEDGAKVEPFNAAGIDWLSANPPIGGNAPMGGGMGAPGTIAGKGPRD